MKFFLDENFPRAALDFLRNSAHSATHALDHFPPGTSDERLFAHAQTEAAIFISTDKDFFHTVPLTCPQHAGAIVITLHKANRDALLRRLDETLGTLGGRNLSNVVWLVTDTRIYTRRKSDG